MEDCRRELEQAAVANGEGGALDAGREADLHHFPELVFVNAHLFGVELIVAVYFYQAPEDQEGGYGLGDRGGGGYPGHAHMEDNDEKEVENHVYHPG